MMTHYLHALLLTFLFTSLLFSGIESCGETCQYDSDCPACSEATCCICAPHWNRSIDEMACRPSCERKHKKYVGYPECAKRMDWLSHNWYKQYKEGYMAAGIDGTICSIQRFLRNEINARHGNIEHHCPDPDWEDHSMDIKVNKDGSETFLVYRALRSHKWDNPHVPDEWATRLLNANAASLGGVLGYLHTEVIPDDMREHQDMENHKRKWDYDAIMLFNVTIKTPEAVQTKYANMMGPFTAFDSGRCTGGEAVCDFENSIGAFAPGRQEQTGNPRHAYSNAWWYSFPQCGYCEWPTGEADCTYTYNVVGMFKIDDLVFPHTCPTEDCSGGYSGPCKPDSHPSHCEWWLTDTKEEKSCAPGATACEKQTFEKYIQTGEKEYERNRPTNADDCRIDGRYAATVSGLDFWYYVCERRMCDDRMQLLDKLPLNKSVARGGQGPFEGTCRPGYTIEPGLVKYEPDSPHEKSTCTRLECETKCNEDIGCEAFGWMKDTSECRTYQYGSMAERTPAWWPGSFYHRNARPPPTVSPTVSPTVTTASPTTLSPTKTGETRSPTKAPHKDVVPVTDSPVSINEKAKKHSGTSPTPEILWIFIASLAAVAILAVALFAYCRFRANRDTSEKALLLQDNNSGEYIPPDGVQMNYAGDH